MHGAGCDLNRFLFVSLLLYDRSREDIELLCKHGSNVNAVDSNGYLGRYGQLLCLPWYSATIGMTTIDDTSGVVR